MIDTTTRPAGLTREAVEELARRRAEPDWLRRLRLDAFAAYEATPLDDIPTGNWRRANLKGLDLEHQAALSGDATVPASASTIEVAARLVQMDGATVEARLDPALAARGVRVLDLPAALRDAALADRVQSAFGQVVAPTTDKFTALHYAFLNAGAVVHVPRNVVVDRPIALEWRFAQPELAAFVHVLVLVDDGAEVAVLDASASEAREGAPLASGVVEIAAGRGAQVRYVRLQDWAADVWDFSAQRATLGPDAHLRTLNAALGARHSRTAIQVALEGNGSQADILGLVPGTGRQHADFQTLQDHHGSATRSDLVIHNALDDQASTNFTGLIRINADARQTESSQEQKNVLLSPKAKADSDPKLEILNNDVVRCTHGAAVGPIDPEALFYLESRGLPRDEALDLLLEGFFQTVVEKLEMPQLQISVWEAVQRKLRRAEG